MDKLDTISLRHAHRRPLLAPYPAGTSNYPNPAASGSVHPSRYSEIHHHEVFIKGANATGCPHP